MYSADMIQEFTINYQYLFLAFLHALLSYIICKKYNAIADKLGISRIDVVITFCVIHLFVLAHTLDIKLEIPRSKFRQVLETHQTKN